MDITNRTQGSTEIVYVRGQVTMYDTMDIEQSLALLRQTNKLKVVLNLKDVDFMDSSGLGFFLKKSREFKKLGGDLKLAEPPANVENLIKKTFGKESEGLLYSKEEDAISALA